MARSRPSAPGGAPAAGRDRRWLALVIHLTFFLLLGAALVRYVQRHGAALPVLALAGTLALLYGFGPALGRLPATGPPAAVGAPPDAVRRPSARHLLWLGVLVVVWAALVALAPSFSWCAVPLFYTALRTLPPPAAYGLVAFFTGFVVLAQLRLAARFDLDLVVGPPAVAALALAVFTSMDRQSARQAVLIHDLARTHRELAATERRAGTLAERQRLAVEIHDSLAQGLSSQQMLLQAADRLWDADPRQARAHVRAATSIAERSLAEARRFVHDLAPADLAEGGGLEAALQRLASRESTAERSVHCRVDDAVGAPALPGHVQSALLRIAQGALANVREHSGASRAALTLSHLGDQVRLDIADNGRGFDTAAPHGPRQHARGHGLPAIRARVRQVGGALTVESAPGDGTVVSVSVPLHPASAKADTP
ncbi:sensor histidine kinase [Streptomyces qinglanensis]|uniref:sensor histidine kinase n=1 Tax=Streptomyces qinglanensis TaxID=943816 RepID=UPI0037A8F8EE